MLWPQPPQGLIAQRLYQRQQEAFEAGEVLAELMLEPWEGDLRVDGLKKLMASLHLYARVLDDAVDEGLLAHRGLILRAQPLVWRVASELTLLAPERATSLLEVVSRVCRANTPEAHPDEVSVWGMKNEHLLLAPLCLAHNPTHIIEARPDLLVALWGMQALDELRRALTARELKRLSETFKVYMSDLKDRSERLAGAGWVSLARRHHRDLLDVELRLISEGGLL